MKRKLFYCTLFMTALLLGGCGSQNNQNNPETSGTDSNAPSTTVEETQNATEEQTAAETQTTTDEQTATDQNAATDHNTAADQNTATDSNAAADQSAAQNQAGTTNNQSNAENSEMIPEEKAKEIALSHAGLSADQVTFIKSGLDFDNGRKNYDIEFYTAEQKEYDYEIDPYTGDIRDYDSDAEYYAQADIDGENNISEEDAKQIALEKVPGATDQDIRKFKTDRENSRLVYEGKIYYEQKEYEFEISAADGAILEWDEEPIYGANS